MGGVPRLGVDWRILDKKWMILQVLEEAFVIESMECVSIIPLSLVVPILNIGALRLVRRRNIVFPEYLDLVSPRQEDLLP